MVFSGLVTACLLARSPTIRSPFFVMATTEGVVRLPSTFSIIFGAPPSIKATAEFVVPKSIPIILLIFLLYILLIMFFNNYFATTNYLYKNSIYDRLYVCQAKKSIPTKY